MLQMGTADTAAVPEYVHGQVERSRGRHLQIDYSHLYGGYCRMEVDVTVQIWRVPSTPVVMSVAAAARHELLCDGLGLGQVEQMNLRKE